MQPKIDEAVDGRFKYAGEGSYSGGELNFIDAQAGCNEMDRGPNCHPLIFAYSGRIVFRVKHRSQLEAGLASYQALSRGTYSPVLALPYCLPDVDETSEFVSDGLHEVPVRDKPSALQSCHKRLGLRCHWIRLRF
jgi:hypothetical protein